MSLLTASRLARSSRFIFSRSLVSAAKSTPRRTYYGSLLLGTAFGAGVLALATPKIHLDSPVTRTSATLENDGNITSK